MKQGLLWYDDNPAHSLQRKVADAYRRHVQKYGEKPDMCYVHHSVITGKEAQLETVRLVASKLSLLHHYWIGVESSTPGARG